MVFHAQGVRLRPRFRLRIQLQSGWPRDRQPHVDDAGETISICGPIRLGQPRPHDVDDLPLRPRDDNPVRRHGPPVQHDRNGVPDAGNPHAQLHLDSRRATYGSASQLLTVGSGGSPARYASVSETRTYNNMLQLTHLVSAAGLPTPKRIPAAASTSNTSTIQAIIMEEWRRPSTTRSAKR